MASRKGAHLSAKRLVFGPVEPTPQGFPGQSDFQGFPGVVVGPIQGPGQFLAVIGQVIGQEADDTRDRSFADLQTDDFGDAVEDFAQR